MKELLVLTFLFIFFSNTHGLVEIWQRDFDEGTYLLTEPGEYRIMEDIVFNPNSVASLGVSPYDSGDVLPSQFSKYNPAAFGIGFFAAIAISANDAVLDLNGHTISQSAEHALQQRFFAIIELADRPFVPSQGPHDFGPAINSATRVTIRNGVLGLSSHHGIHGNFPADVTIEDLVIRDYEVAAIACNCATNLLIQRVHSMGSRIDVPVSSTFSAARFIRPYVNFLVDSNYQGTIQIGDVVKDASDIKGYLKESIEHIFEDVIVAQNGKTGGFINPTLHPKEYARFHNALGIIDGNAYGFLLNKAGVAVNGFPVVPEEDPSRSVKIIDCSIRDHVADVNEVLSFSTENGDAVTDPVGAVFQVFNTHPQTGDFVTISSEDFSQATYLGDPVSNAQAFVSKAILEGAFESSFLDTSRNKINQDILNWIEAGDDSPLRFLSDLLERSPLVCNIDSMVHSNKGVIGMKIDGAYKVRIQDIEMYNITNFGSIGSTLCDYDTTTFSNNIATLPGYQGAVTRGFSFAGSVDVELDNVVVKHVESRGSAYCFDAFLDSHGISIENSFCRDVFAGKSYQKEDFFGPNELPLAIGFHAADSTADVSFVDCDANNFVNFAGGAIEFFRDLSLDMNEIYSSDSATAHDESSSNASKLIFSISLFFLLFF